MASAARGTPWPSSLLCRPSASHCRFPTTSLRCLPMPTRALSLAAASASSSYTAVKPDNSEKQRPRPQDEDEDEDENDSEDEGVKRSESPSIEYGNVLRFKAPYNVQIFVDENESDESIVTRFRKECLKEGILRDVRRRRFHESRQDKKKRKSKESIRRARNASIRRARKRRSEENEDNFDSDDDNDDDDNWELPEEEIGF